MKKTYSEVVKTSPRTNPAPSANQPPSTPPQPQTQGFPMDPTDQALSFADLLQQAQQVNLDNFPQHLAHNA